MKYIFYICLFFASTLYLQAQSNEELTKVIDNFFVAMEAKDTVALDSLMHPQCMLFSTLTKKGAPYVQPLRKASFLGFMRRAIDKKYVYDERLWTYDVSIEDNLATVWTEYTLFTGNENKVSHCGVNVFTLVRMSATKWMITNVANTRRSDNCIEEATPTQNKEAIHKLMDAWHHAAATADEDVFYGTMTEDGIYLGTDASERWLRDELRTWAKSAFDRDTAWAFTPSKREIYFSDNQKTAWFEESLDTWMGDCRGSGVLIKVGRVWKLKHYDLAMMVPNDLVKDFISLVEMGGLPKKKNKKSKNKRK